MSKAISKFEVALGEEDGNKFAAIMWPTEMGKSPFIEAVNLLFTQEGFAVFPEGSEQAVEFKGVDDKALYELASRHVVILEQNGDDFDQYPVNKLNQPA